MLYILIYKYLKIKLKDRCNDNQESKKHKSKFFCVTNGYCLLYFEKYTNIKSYLFYWKNKLHTEESSFKCWR